MCLALAGKIVEINKDQVMVDYDGLQKWASGRLFPDLVVGDYVLVHAGFVIQKLQPDYARELIALDKEVGLYGE